MGGLWAGLVWELFNYWARCKWIYTVPGLEDWKLFEMPILGFLGFPVFALEGFVFYSLVSHLWRGGRSWEASAPPPERPVPRRARAVAVTVAAAFSLAVHVVAFEHEPFASRHARRPLLADLEGVGPADVERLRAAGLATPERLHAALERDGSERLAAHLEIAPQDLARARRHAALALHKGMGTDMARLLLRAGISDVAELAASDVGVLVRDLAAVAARDGLEAPRPAAVEAWVRAARWNDGKTRR